MEIIAIAVWGWDGINVAHTRYIDDFSLADFRVSYQFNSPSPEKERP